MLENFDKTLWIAVMFVWFASANKKISFANKVWEIKGHPSQGEIGVQLLSFTCSWKIFHTQDEGIRWQWIALACIPFVGSKWGVGEPLINTANWEEEIHDIINLIKLWGILIEKSIFLIKDHSIVFLRSILAAT